MPFSPTPSRPSVLVVEDTDDIREVVSMLLESEGYEVHTACDGREALHLLHTLARPCVILLDLMMPVMSGRELLAELERDHRLANIPVVITTADPHVDDLAARPLLRKPVVVEALLAAVREHCFGPPSRPAPPSVKQVPSRPGAPLKSPRRPKLGG